MDVKPLLDLTCAKVASLLKGKTPEQIRKDFNIANDFTPGAQSAAVLRKETRKSSPRSPCAEEEAAVRAENKWAEDN